MGACTADIEWDCGGQDFLGGRYSRAHTLRFDGGVVVQGSSSPSIVPEPWSMAAAVDPEEMFVASLSACHMLWFLDYARRSGAEVAHYRDTASGVLATNADGRMCITRVVLRPKVRFADPLVPAALAAALHHQAHEACYLANSVLTEVLVEPVGALQEDHHG